MATHFFGLTSRTYKYSHAVGRAEFAGTGFRNPTDMAIAADGTVYICNRSYENRPDGVHITVITMDEDYVTEFGAYGEADGEFMWPTSVALDKNDDIYVADWRNDRIQVFNSAGEWQQSFGSTGSEVGQFNRPNGVAVDDSGDIFVTDWGNNRVQVFASDGRFITQFVGDATLSKWGRDKLASNPDMILQRNLAYAVNPHHESSFGHPCAVKIDPQGRICVLDNNRGRIQVYVRDEVPVLH